MVIFSDKIYSNGKDAVGRSVILNFNRFDYLEVYRTKKNSLSKFGDFVDSKIPACDDVALLLATRITDSGEENYKILAIADVESMSMIYDGVMGRIQTAISQTNITEPWISIEAEVRRVCGG